MQDRVRIGGIREHVRVRRIRRASWLSWLSVFAFASVAGPAFARNDILDVEVERAKEFRGRRSVLEMPFYLRGQSTPEIVETIQTMSTRKVTRGFGRSDLHACSIAFQSAVIQLQERAFSIGANAVVDVVSVVDGRVVEFPDRFRCVVGDMIARVSLSAKAVKIEE